MNVLKNPVDNWDNRQQLSILDSNAQPWFVEQGKIAISGGKLTTVGLYTCVAVAASYNGTNFLSHVDAHTNAYLLRDCILGAFLNLDLDESQSFRVHILNGNLVSHHAHRVAKEALEMAGLTTRTVEKEEDALLTMFDEVVVTDNQITVKRRFES